MDGCKHNQYMTRRGKATTNMGSSCPSSSTTSTRKAISSFLMCLLFQEQSQYCTSFTIQHNDHVPVVIKKWNSHGIRHDNSLRKLNRQRTDILNEHSLLKRRRRRSGMSNLFMSPSTRSVVDVASEEYVPKTSGKKYGRLPPWFPERSSNRILEATQAKYNMELLLQTLEIQASYDPSSWTREDIDQIMESIDVAAVAAAEQSSSTNSMHEVDQFRSGASEFLILLMNVVADKEIDSSSKDQYKHASKSSQFSVLTKETLVAAAFHYCDCIVAREGGIYDMIESIIHYPQKNDDASDTMLPLSSSSTTAASKYPVCIQKQSDSSALVPFSLLDMEKFGGLEDDQSVIDVKGTSSNSRTKSTKSGGRTVTTPVTSSSTPKCSTAEALDNNIEGRYGQETAQIYSSAGKIKRSEIMANAMLSKAKAPSTPADAASLRGLLLSMTDDWRGLVIRSVACLYRLQGILRNQASSSHLEFASSSSITLDGENGRMARRLAREALSVYAPLTQRLGMHKLKSEIENLAFQILYKRQYHTAMSLYTKSGIATLETIMSQVTTEIKQTLLEDDFLTKQLDRLTVTARIKQPYSLWRKLLRQKFERKQQQALPFNDDDSQQSKTTASTLSLMSIADVSDVIALRVVLRSRKDSVAPSHQELREEEFLCYYIQKKILNLWPTSNERFKDYINMPKPNGYQSLHHTVRINKYDQEWPFEVQIRTEDMHMRSEFGVAAHWDYKMTGKTSSSNHKSAGALPPATTVISSGQANNYMPPKQSASTKWSDLKEPRSSPSVIETAPIRLFERDNTRKVAPGMETSRVGDNHETKIQSSSLVPQSLSHANMVESYVDALVVARDHLRQKSVFVYMVLSPSSTSTASALEGKVIGVTSGSTIRDALVEASKRWNWNCDENVLLSHSGDDICCTNVFAADREVLLNGQKTDLNAVLSNGDVLTLPVLLNPGDNATVLTSPKRSSNCLIAGGC